MIGRQLLHYELQDELGRGGMGVVYRALDTKLHRTVAVKVLPPDLVGDPSRRRRFLQEARTAAAVTHPYVATLHEAGEAEDHLFLVMEYVEGKTLRAHLVEGGLDLEDRVRLCTEIAEGMAAAHGRNVVHRDLKPENVMVTPDGHAKILDFGLAKLYEPDDDNTLMDDTQTMQQQLTIEGQILGTPAYMSPEQARGQEVDARSDVFSFGCMLYETLTGVSPFRGPTRMDTISSVLQSEPLPVSQVLQQLPVALDRIVSKTLQKQPERRYQSTQDLVLDLRELRHETLGSEVRRAPSSPGVAGASGVPGAQGVPGAPGMPGASGEPGLSGVPGLPGRSDLSGAGGQPGQPHREAAIAGRRGRRVFLLAALGVTVAAAALLLGRQLLDGGSSGDAEAPPATTSVPSPPSPPEVAAPLRPNWILVAALQGSEEQENLADAARELVVASLQQSSVVTPISGAQIRRGLHLADLPPDTRIEGDVARQLAFRAAARTYVEGRIDRIGDGYSIVLHVTDAEDGALVVSVTGAAADETQLIPTIDDLGRQLRARLGEQESAVAGERPLREIITPSFEAYRSYVRATELQGRREFRASNDLLRQAIGLDREFASAWSALGGNFHNLGHPDSSRTAFERALALPRRLTETQRLSLQALLAFLVDRDFHAGLELYDRLLEERPFVADFHNNRGIILFNLGLYEEALEAQRRAGEVRPFGPTQLHLSNQQRTLMQLGRLDEARVLAEQLTGGQRQLAELNLALAASDWELVETLAREGRQGGGLLPFASDLSLATAAVVRGRLDEARERLVELSAPAPFYEHVRCMAGAQLWILSRPFSDAGPAVGCEGGGTAERIVRGIVAAASGDSDLARSQLDTLKTTDVREQRRYATDIVLLEAWVAASRDDWASAHQLLAPLVTQGPGPWFTGRMPLRWLAAVAFERTERWEDAARHYELVLSPLRMHHDTWPWWGIASNFARHRLVLLYARMGRPADARRHWEALQADLTEPAPSLEAMARECRSALEGQAP